MRERRGTLPDREWGPAGACQQPELHRQHEVACPWPEGPVLSLGPVLYDGNVSWPNFLHGSLVLNSLSHFGSLARDCLLISALPLGCKVPHEHC